MEEYLVDESQFVDFSFFRSRDSLHTTGKVIVTVFANLEGEYFLSCLLTQQQSQLQITTFPVQPVHVYFKPCESTLHGPRINSVLR